MKKTLTPLLVLLAGRSLATTYPMTLHHLEWGADPEGFFHGTAFNLLAPKGWEVGAQTGWNLVDTKNVNRIAGAHSPDRRSGYKDGWIKPAGDVVLRDDVGDDPNQGTGGGRTRMRKG